MKGLFILASTLLMAFTTSAQNGVLDLNFNSTGYINNAVGSANSIAVDPSGNTVVLGHDRNSSTKHVYVYRYTSSGQLDNTFGLSGAVTFDLNNDYDYGRCIKALPNGKYLISGQNSVGAYFRGYVARLNANGTADLTFGNAGKLIIDPIQTNLDVWSIDVAADGNIYAAGYMTVSSVITATMWKISPNGTLDPNFGTAGVASIYNSIYGSRFFGIDYNDNNQTIGVTGTITNVSTPEGLIALFDTAGVLKRQHTSVAHAGNPTTLYDVCLRDNSILACGFHNNNANNKALVLAYDFSGNPLTSFANNGVYTDNQSTLSQFNQMDEDCDGSLYLGGHLLYNTMKSFYIVKFSASGVMDANFASNGQFVTRLNPSYDEFIEGMSLHGTNGIVACGRTYVGATAARSGIVKVTVPVCNQMSVEAMASVPQSLNCYPNPLNNGQSLKLISASHIAVLQIFNAQGQLVFESNDLTAQLLHELQLPGLASGVYHVVARGETQNSQTLLIQ